MTKHQEKERELREKSFTQEFKEGKEGVINSLSKFEKKVDYFNVYENGEIISAEVDLSDSAKDILSALISDFEAYQELVSMGYDVSAGKIDLIGIIEFSRDIHKEQILYDRDKEEFFLQ